MLISIDTQKGVQQNSTSFHDKNTKKKKNTPTGIEGDFLNKIKGIYLKLQLTPYFNGEKLKALFLRSGTRGQRCPLLPLLFNIILEILARAIRQEKEIIGIQIAKKKIKLSLFADDMILGIENPKESTRKLLELIN